MRTWLIALTAATLAACATPPAEPPAPGPEAFAAAVADAARPQADRDRDANRRPAEVLAFAGVRPGMTVVDAIPGGGYWSRLFAAAVGPQGKVVAYVPSELASKFNSEANAKAVADAYANVDYHSDPLKQTGSPFADMAFTFQNYHDFHTQLFGPPDVAAVNRAVWSILKPGGLYVIGDHSAAAGSGARDVNTLHRIDPAQVRQEVEAAGFVYEGTTTVLANPADPRTANVFDAGIRGRTDQFVMKFRKPR